MPDSAKLPARRWSKPIYRLWLALLVLGLGLFIGANWSRGEVIWRWLNSDRGPKQNDLLYIAPDGQNNDQIFGLDLAQKLPVQLTGEAYGVWDYAVSPDGTAMVYSVMGEAGNSDLWTMTPDGREPHLLLACPEGSCSGASWSPDGARLVYERRAIPASGAEAGPPRLFWLDLAGGETSPVFEDDQLQGFGARWSSDGRWLSYVAPNAQGLQIYNVEEGRRQSIPGQVANLAEWQPQGAVLLVSHIRPEEEDVAMHLLRIEPESGQLTDLSGETAWVEDGSPAWSPDGAWIAFTRKPAGASMGKQIWLMRADGREAHYLTNEPDIHHGLPSWSPDGRYLLYQRYPLKEIGAQPGVWLMEVETGQSEEVVTPGNRPDWLP